MAQHYVSRFYFKPFACDSDKSLVFSMSRDYTIHDKPSQISNICSKKNYNTPEQERTQSSLESEYAEILRNLIATVQGKNNFYIVDEFIQFVSFMLGNNIFARENLIPSVYTINKVVQNGVEVDSKTEKDSGYRRKFGSSITFSSCFYREFQNWMWEFVRLDIGTGEKGFITSDNPVSIFNPENVFTPLDVKLKYDESKTQVAGSNTSNGRIDIIVTVPLENISFRQDVVMVFPVTPKLCLIGFSCTERHNEFKEQSKNMFIEFINLMTLHQCNKAVYSHSKELLRNVKASIPSFVNYCASNNFVPSFDIGIR